MAEVEKFTDEGVMMLLKHAERQLKNDSNKDIVTDKSHLNYSVEQDLGGLSPREFYAQILGNSYLYGRGTQREAEAVTCCSWVVTLPKSISDYSAVEKDGITVLNPDAEKAFFDGALRFVSARYGTVFYNRTHYDEGGQPHIHIYFVPQTKLDHDLVHYKTTKTHETLRLESGRYEFKYRFKMENGERIPLKNYAKISDYYDTKISAADVLNKSELSHFHHDLAEYLKKNNLPGADGVYTGKTSSKNVSVMALKKFTKETGIRLDDLKANPLSKEVLAKHLDKIDFTPADRRSIEAINTQAFIEKLQEQLHDLEVKNSEAATADMTTELAHKDEQILTLTQTIQEKDHLLSESLSHNSELEFKISSLENQLEEKQAELDHSKATEKSLEEKLKVLEEKSTEKQPSRRDYSWGHSEDWGSSSGWGKKSIEKDISI